MADHHGSGAGDRRARARYYLVMSRFGLLAGTVADGVDPTAQTFGLSALGWFLVLLPVIGLVLGVVVGIIRRTEEDAVEAMSDVVH